MASISTETPRLGLAIVPANRAQYRVSNITIVASDHELSRVIALHLSQSRDLPECTIAPADRLISSDLRPSGVVVFLPSLRNQGTVPDLGEATKFLQAGAQWLVDRFVLLSSAAVYEASYRNPGLVLESHPLPIDSSAVAAQWRKLEELAHRYCGNSERLTILRCSTLMSVQSANPIANRFVRRAATTTAGYDPSLQLLNPVDLAEAIQCVLRDGVSGVFNVAPDTVIPLREALKRSGTRRIPVPNTILRVAYAMRNKSSADYLDYSRYSWTVSNQKIKAVGFRPKHSSADALAEFRRSLVGPKRDVANAEADYFDVFGMDKKYIAAFGRTLFRFLADWYWRIETAGLEHIPQHGRAVLAGVHRGFMPWDGVMALHLIVSNTRRYPRFLIHPGLVKFPFLANFMTKLGGIVACQENAQRILESDELLGVFPEGIQGAFVRYSEAYQIHGFHRDAFVKMALRHRAPIIPFVTVGSAEIFPVLGKLKSRLWTKYSEWPAFPITPTFPLIPVPLPSKWHTRFLPAMHIESDYPPSAAANASVVRAISREVRSRMQNAIDEMLQQRRSIFFGSIFPSGAK